MNHKRTNGWRRASLGEFFRIKHGWAFKGEFFSDSGPYVLLTPGNFTEEGGLRLKGEKEKYYTGKVPPGYILKRGDLLVVMTEQAEGLLGSPAIIPEGDHYLHNQRLGLVVDNDESLIDKLFLYYLFNLREVRAQIRATANGAKVRHTSPDRIYQVKVQLPPLPLQQRIASILSAYDDLIENNTRRIKILEEMARAIYREWFVHFRFPGHEKIKLVDSPMGKIPEGWELRNLFDIAEVTYGFPFSSKQFTEEPVGQPLIRIRDIKDNQTNTFTSESVDGKYVVVNGDLIVGMDGDFHMGKWAGGQPISTSGSSGFALKRVYLLTFFSWASKHQSSILIQQ